MTGVWVLLAGAATVAVVRLVVAVVNGRRYLAAAERHSDELVDLMWSHRIREQTAGRDRDEARQRRRARSNARGQRRRSALLHTRRGAR